MNIDDKRIAEIRARCEAAQDSGGAWTIFVRHAEDDISYLLAALVEARKFKAFVHAYLDQHGVPHGDPSNKHQQEGCRIGARLDLLLQQRDEARAAREADKQYHGAEPNYDNL